jgi:NADPH:quinone reductase-like Zn-dependent oxidoreductase
VKAIVFDRHGDPAEVLQVRDMPEPQPPFRRVRVRMLAAPINPSDLLTIEGRYGKLPKLPATPGYEGVGIVEATGGGVLGWLRKGKRVALISTDGGTWAEQCVVRAKHVVSVPADVPDEQAAMFFVNPITAVAMVRHVLRVPAGEWLLQSAAGSALGHMVIRLGKLDGFKTINVARRREQAEELRKYGGDVCLVEGDGPIEEQVAKVTNGQGVRYAIDPVGGATGTGVVRSLAAGGHALLYGLLSGQPIEVDPRLLITGSKRVEGFWLAEWLPRQSILTTLGIFRQVKALLREGVIKSEIAGTYSIDQIRDAARHVQGAARGGKIILKMK